MFLLQSNRVLKTTPKSILHELVNKDETFVKKWIPKRLIIPGDGLIVKTDHWFSIPSTAKKERIK